MPAFSTNRNIPIYKVNNHITAKEVRVIDEQGESLGIFSREDALALAKERKLDLIEIAPQANPPVTRIISFDKFRYQQEKEDKKKQQRQRAKSMKRIRITPRAAKKDLQVKVKQTQEFLEAGHRVEINLFLRGREKANKEWGLQKLNEFLEMVGIPHKMTMQPRYSGRGYTTQIVKN